MDLSRFLDYPLFWNICYVSSWLNIIEHLVRAFVYFFFVPRKRTCFLKNHLKCLGIWNCISECKRMCSVCSLWTIIECLNALYIHGFNFCYRSRNCHPLCSIIVIVWNLNKVRTLFGWYSIISRQNVSRIGWYSWLSYLSYWHDCKITSQITCSFRTIKQFCNIITGPNPLIEISTHYWPNSVGSFPPFLPAYRNRSSFCNAFCSEHHTVYRVQNCNTANCNIPSWESFISDLLLHLFIMLHVWFKNMDLVLIFLAVSQILMCKLTVI